MNEWEINSELADYAHRHIKVFVSNQILIADILNTNPFLFIIKRDFLLYSYVRELLLEQGRQILC